MCRTSTWLGFFALLGACASPLTGTESGNPPFVARAALRVEASPDGLVVIGSEGAVEPPGALVELLNVDGAQGFTRTTANPDGSFRVPLEGEGPDEVRVVALVADRRSEVIALSAIANDPSPLDCVSFPGLAVDLTTSASTVVLSNRCGETIDVSPAGLRFGAVSLLIDPSGALSLPPGAEFLGYRKVHALESAIADYHAHWYIPAIRELAARPDFRADPAWIAAILVPAISKARAKKALEVLFRLNLLVEGDDGLVRRADALVSTGEQTRSIHMARFHREMLERAVQALEMPSTEREISSVTLCMGPEGLAKLKEATRSFRRALLALEELEGDPAQVYQVNLQLFPLSRL